MARQQPTSKDQSTTDTTTTDAVEQRLVAFAAQLGTLVGTVQAKTDGWLDRDALAKQLGDIRDRASELLGQVNPTALKRVAATPGRVPTPSPKAKAAAGAAKSARTMVDAPGKRHRKPPPQTKVGKHASEPKARVIGNPGLKTGRRSARG
jgi:hypothetical protein